MTDTHTRTEQLSRIAIGLATLLVVVGMIAPGAVLAQPQPGHQVYGAVTDQNGGAVGGVTVEAVDTDGATLVSTTTDANGSYSMDVEGPNDGDEFNVIAVENDPVDTGDSQQLTFETARGDEVDLQVSVSDTDDNDDDSSDDSDDDSSDDSDDDSSDDSDDDSSDDSDDDSSDDSDDDSSGGGGGGGGFYPGDDDDDDDNEAPTEETVDIVTDEESDTSLATFDEVSTVESIIFNQPITGESTVRNLDRSPDETGTLPGTPVAFSEVTVPENAQDTSATIRKRISKDRLSERDIESNELTVYRFADDEWTALDTEIVSESDTHVTIEAETPGFSYFAVSTADESTGESTDDGSDDSADDGGTESTDDDAGPDDESDDSNTVFLALIGLAFLFAVGASDYVIRRQNGSDQPDESE